MKLRRKILLLFLLFVPGSLYSQTSTEDNLYAFAMISGSIRYFYPDSSLQKTDWTAFLIRGVETTLRCRTKRELCDSLQSLFRNVAGVRISGDSIVLPDRKLFSGKGLYWQHRGDGIDASNPAFNNISPYQSKIVYHSKERLFKERPHKNLSIKIFDSLYFSMPLLLSGNSCPGDNVLLTQNLYEPSSIEKDYVDFIVLWNALLHFYPYRENQNFESLFYKHLQNYRNGFHPLDYLMAGINDGHAFSALGLDLEKLNQLPFRLKKIENKYIVTNTLVAGIEVGDEIIAVNNTRLDSLERLYSTVISGSAQLREYRFLHVFLGVDSLQTARVSLVHEKDTMRLEIQKQAFNFSFRISDYRDDYNAILKFGDVYYANLSRISISEIRSRFNEMASAKGIIFDLRNYPLPQSFELLNYLDLPKALRNEALFGIPQIHYPFYNEVSYSKTGWDIKPSDSLFHNNIVFLIDANTISYGESIASILKGSPVKLIGQPTAGANGDIKSILLPSGKEVWFTGLISRLHGGKTYHALGIQPDISVEESIEGVKDHRDEILQKALEYINQSRI